MATILVTGGGRGLGRLTAGATDSFVFMATDPGVGKQPGLFWGEQKPIESSPESRDAAKADRFFAWGLRTVGLGG